MEKGLYSRIDKALLEQEFQKFKEMRFPEQPEEKELYFLYDELTLLNTHIIGLISKYLSGRRIKFKQLNAGAEFNKILDGIQIESNSLESMITYKQKLDVLVQMVKTLEYKISGLPILEEDERMGYRNRRKKIIIGVIVVLSIVALYIVPVLAQGVSLGYWSKLGYPNAIKVYLNRMIGEYPGHSLECLRFPDKLMGDMEDNAILEYTEKGSGIDRNGYNLHVGDSREDVIEELSYLYPEGKGERYELGCYFCDTGYILVFNFVYDENNIVTKMTIKKENYRD